MPHKKPVMKYRTYTKKVINKKGELKVYSYSKMYDINKKIICGVCGGRYTTCNSWRHKNKTKKHQRALEALREGQKDADFLEVQNNK